MLRKRPWIAAIILFIILSAALALVLSKDKREADGIGESYQASASFGDTQGKGQWFFQQRPPDGGDFTDLTYDGKTWSGSEGNWIDKDTFNPAKRYDSVRKWVAPQTGTVRITGRVFKADEGGDGVVVSVQKNHESMWHRILQPGDQTGYATDADLSRVPVNAGDAIYFIANSLPPPPGDWGSGDDSKNATRWDPVVTYISDGSSGTPAKMNQEWSLNTDDTSLTLAVRDNRPIVLAIKNAEQGWNWIAEPVVMPLLDKVYVGTKDYNPDWSFKGAKVDKSDGTKVTLRFESTKPKLELESVWQARPGAGPVEQSATILNKTGRDITYQHSDVVSADFSVRSDKAATVTRFSRSSMQSNTDRVGFNTGVFKETLSEYSNVQSIVSNDFFPNEYVLPFEMLDVSGEHGLYFGYVWDFGLYSNRTYGDPLQIHNLFFLGQKGSITEAAGKKLNVPGMFFGAYKGDIDAGSNKMKKWFWNYKITPTLKANANEPLTEFGIDLYTEGELSDFLSRNSLASWGVELIKEDAYYTTDGVPPGSPYANGQPQPNYDPFFGWAWTPDPEKWPNGMTLGKMAHENGVKLSIYLGNRFEHADLATQAGRDKQKKALLERFDDWQFDYWRSDMEYEEPLNYLSHEGFLEVLDDMIAQRKGFRWENCSSGGSKKSFDLLQRQTIMTTEDSGGGPDSVINYRKAYYANSYMINPVQLKDDNGENISGDAWLLYQMRTGFLGAWMYGGDYSSNEAAHVLELYKKHVDLYRTKQRPILRGADVYHILPIPDGKSWDGMQFFNEGLNKGSVLLFKPGEDEPDSKVIKLKGLDRDATYTLTFQDRIEQNTSMTGAELMDEGINVTKLTGAYASEIIWIN
ncbi:GH36 C-terminal domain-containing protein [Cohnella nanjingensis]|uniref:GH36 C-terminal domain-containing protein n=1 Tax=Cohnella nanjingensis TaxID=1387779 RepID=A0A7X0RNK2_9BACL|nr:GH36 C-terminal domain-containing protein [Cohnella nanjingensis]MBB6670812.1 GH36 C-terminal domain-containing protein [Cohnella nanjingensis]